MKRVSILLVFMLVIPLWGFAEVVMEMRLFGNRTWSNPVSNPRGGNIWF